MAPSSAAPSLRDRVLMIAYTFPPFGGIAGRRLVKYARYLRDFGWEPVVVTVGDHPEWGGASEELMHEIPPDLRVIRTRAVSPGGTYQWGRRALGGTIRRRIRSRLVDERPYRSLRAGARSVLLPDDRVGWLPFAFWAGLRAARRERVRVIFSTAPPPTGHLVGFLLKRATGLPWVVEFRDPWSRNTRLVVPSRLHRRAIAACEHAFLARADAVVATSQTILDDFAASYRDLDPRKFTVITNGYDEADYAGLAPQPSSSFRLVYTGSISSFSTDDRRTPVFFFRGLRALLAERPHLRRDLEVHFFGRPSEYLQVVIDELDLHDLVHAHSFVPHPEAVAQMVSADALLLLHEVDDRAGPPGKVFEYLRAGRPILALSAEGETARLVRRYADARVVPPKDTAAIARAVGDLYDRWASGVSGGSAPRAEIAQFERRFLTGRLAEVLRAVGAGTLIPQMAWSGREAP